MLDLHYKRTNFKMEKLTYNVGLIVLFCIKEQNI